VLDTGNKFCGISGSFERIPCYIPYHIVLLALYPRHIDKLINGT
jgi:hypothetical protein